MIVTMPSTFLNPEDGDILARPVDASLRRRKQVIPTKPLGYDERERKKKSQELGRSFGPSICSSTVKESRLIPELNASSLSCGGERVKGIAGNSEEWFGADIMLSPPWFIREHQPQMGTTMHATVKWLTETQHHSAPSSCPPRRGKVEHGLVGGRYISFGVVAVQGNLRAHISKQ
ncbi:hypothetical protein chiPu_0025262 [Chiloscyllium punctatum]|uniref:Uncharacterized protein n=1 Tax=Chiloscyllium punctatum TaxID=137246 RepID=A0A401TEU6_CHIPU|nr:hypothetical protein [Chiloscyllium punctatum]